MLKYLFTLNVLVANLSKFAGEDGMNASSAGQMETFLTIVGEVNVSCCLLL